MKKISIYVVNKKLKPANYYRIVQYAKKIPGTKVYSITPTIWFGLAVLFRETKWKNLFQGISYEVSMKRMKRFLKKDLKRKPDYIVVQKSMTKRRVSSSIRQMQEELLKNSTVIWDFDDNILEGKEILHEEYDLYCKYAKHILVTSEFLKNTLPEECRNKVMLLPTTDMQMPIKKEELDKVNKKRKQKMKDKINIIWVATSGNIFHLESVLDILDETAKEIKDTYNKQLVLKIVCDKGIKRKYEYLEIRNIIWTRKRAIKEVKKASIGIMPLIDSKYARGKGGFKLIQYISTGLPVIASNVGYNNTIFKDDIGFLLQDQQDKKCWKNAILELIESDEKWEKYSRNAYNVWKKHYNYEENLKIWKKLLS